MKPKLKALRAAKLLIPFLKKYRLTFNGILSGGVLMCWLGLPLPAWAQYKLYWQNWDSLNRALPTKSVRIRKFEGSLPNGRKMAAYLAIIILKDKHLQVQAIPAAAGKGLIQTSALARENNAVVAVNGGYFTFQPDTARNGLTSVSLLIHRGELLTGHVLPVFRKDSTGENRALYPTRSAVAFTGKKAVFAWTFTDSLKRTWAYSQPNPFTLNPLQQEQPSFTFPVPPQRWNPEEAMGGGPMLVWKGKRFITDRQEWFTQIANPNPRTAVGLDRKGRLLLLVVDGRQPGYSEGVTFAELAEIFLGLRAVYALNLDGGGSSAMAVNGAVINRPSDKTGERRVASIVSVSVR